MSDTGTRYEELIQNVLHRARKEQPSLIIPTTGSAEIQFDELDIVGITTNDDLTETINFIMNVESHIHLNSQIHPDLNVDSISPTDNGDMLSEEAHARSIMTLNNELEANEITALPHNDSDDRWKISLAQSNDIAGCIQDYE